MMDEEMNQMTQEELIALAKQQDPKDRVPCIIRDDLPFPSDVLPEQMRVHTKRARDLFGLRPGETWEEHFARTNANK